MNTYYCCLLLNQANCIPNRVFHLLKLVQKDSATKRWRLMANRGVRGRSPPIKKFLLFAVATNERTGRGHTGVQTPYVILNILLNRNPRRVVEQNADGLYILSLFRQFISANKLCSVGSYKSTTTVHWTDMVPPL